MAAAQRRRTNLAVVGSRPLWCCASSNLRRHCIGFRWRFYTPVDEQGPAVAAHFTTTRTSTGTLHHGQASWSGLGSSFSAAVRLAQLVLKTSGLTGEAQGGKRHSAPAAEQPYSS